MCHREPVRGPLSRHGGRGQVVGAGDIHRAMSLVRHQLCDERQPERQSRTPTGRAFRECRMQFPQHCVVPRIDIVGIATFVEAVEISLNRIACDTAPRMCARNAHVGPLIRTWAAPPRHGIAGLRAIVRVSARNSGVACEQRTRPGAVVPVSQTTSPTTSHRWRLSPRWSALWAPHRPEPQPRRPEPRPHRHQTGGIAALEPRHAGDTPTGGT